MLRFGSLFVTLPLCTISHFEQQNPFQLLVRDLVHHLSFHQPSHCAVDKEGQRRKALDTKNGDIFIHLPSTAPLHLPLTAPPVLPKQLEIVPGHPKLSCVSWRTSPTLSHVFVCHHVSHTVKPCLKAVQNIRNSLLVLCFQDKPSRQMPQQTYYQHIRFTPRGAI